MKLIVLSLVFTCLACLVWAKTENEKLFVPQTTKPVFEPGFEAGSAKSDLTPKLDKTVFLAGFDFNRTAEGVHDQIWARCLTISDGLNTIAFVGLDFIGFFYEPDVIVVRQLVQKRLHKQVTVLIASTHNHHGPDTIGIWGQTPLQSGRDEHYIAWVREKISDCIVEAVQSLQPANLVIAKDDRKELSQLQSDSRLPLVKDHTLYVLQAVSKKTGKTIATLVNWANHPEALSDDNRLLSSDYCDGLYRRLEELLDGVVVFWNGAIGGLISPGGAMVIDPETKSPAPKGSFRKAELIGRFIAEVSAEAIRHPDAVKLEKGRLGVKLKPIFIPLQNPLFRVGVGVGISPRPVYTDGQPDERITEQEVTLLGLKLKAKTTMAQDLRTEVGVVTITEPDQPSPTVLFLLIPGEIYPELVYGGITYYLGADFPDAPIEPVLIEHARKTTAKFIFVIGLANDEIGYIIPQCEWDEVEPWLHNAPKQPYGEINSVGWKTARYINEALVSLLKMLDGQEKAQER